MVLRVTFVGLTFILTAEYWDLEGVDAAAAAGAAADIGGDILFWLELEGSRGSGDLEASFAFKTTHVEIARYLSNMLYIL